LYEESLALKREMGDKWGIAGLLNNLGNMAFAQGDYSAAWALYKESLALGREMGDKWGTAMSLYNLGNVAFAQGDYSAARELQAESLMLAREIGDKSDMAYALFVLGLADLAEHRPEAREYILHSLRLRQEMGRQLQQTSSLIGVAGLVLEGGKAHFAAQLLGAVASALKTLNAVAEPDVKFFHEQTLAAVCEQVGEAAFQSAWEEGSNWSLEEAVTRALNE
jgi:tetratricopeptide (TPR) repeat protein